MNKPSEQLIQAINDFATGGPRMFEEGGHKYYFVRDGNAAKVYRDRDPEAPKERYEVPGIGWPFSQEWLYKGTGLYGY